MIASVAGRLRFVALGAVNSRICRRATKELPTGHVPSYIVVTPHLAHLAPLATRNHSERIAPVFVANGIGASDLEWLASICPMVPIIRLRTSLGRNPSSLIEHGIVINHLAEAARDTFCTQDADCFVSDASFWDSVTIDEDKEYATGPFLRRAGEERPEFPETFLVCLNGALMKKYKRFYGITAETTARPGARARRLLRDAGYPDGKYLETLKSYYDTLQQFWVAARYHGYRYRLLPGNGQTVHHIGGTSYLHDVFDDLAHWDYWALGVQYFHLRLLELPACERFRGRFKRLIEFHGSAAALLAAYPGFSGGRRRQQADLIIEATGADELYGGGEPGKTT